MFWKNKGKPRTVRFSLPSLHTSVTTLLQAGHAQRPLLVLLLCLWNPIKERCSIRGRRLSPSHPGNHKGYHVSDEFPELRTQRYILLRNHANFLREKLKDLFKILWKQKKGRGRRRETHYYNYIRWQILFLFKKLGINYFISCFYIKSQLFIFAEINETYSI